MPAALPQASAFFYLHPPFAAWFFAFGACPSCSDSSGQDGIRWPSPPHRLHLRFQRLQGAPPAPSQRPGIGQWVTLSHSPGRWAPAGALSAPETPGRGLGWGRFQSCTHR